MAESRRREGEALKEGSSVAWFYWRILMMMAICAQSLEVDLVSQLANEHSAVAI